ncbi:IS3 family transposase [Kitasatospora sp. NPDC087315]|uniref:IS3 family transposase n=1 Tax=Kitasatospora sp. NPDC087315 TaxID=3364069 RepID=UPI00382056C4
MDLVDPEREVQAGCPSKYSDEFRRDAVALYRASEGRRTFAAVAKEIGVNHETLRNWVRAADAGPASAGQTLNAEERAELARLRTAERGVAGREGDPAPGSRVFHTGDEVRARRWDFVSAHAAEFGVQRLCEILGVARSGYCAWRAGARARADRAAAEAALVGEIREVHRETRGAYGVPRVRAELRAQGRVVNRKRIARLMREHGIIGRHLCKRCLTIVQDRSVPPAPDLVGRDFTAGGPDVRWAGDITYLPVGGSWMYLATVIDLHSRRLVGWSMADHMCIRLVADVLKAAVAIRGGLVDGVIFHSDGGFQGGSAEFAGLCRCHGSRRSMGKVGSSYDNAAAESFFASLKRELMHGARWASRHQARLEVFRWVSFHSLRRRHSTLGYLSPVQFEQQTAASRRVTLAA